MVTATIESIAWEISHRLDDRMERETNADTAVDNFQRAGVLLRDALSEGLEGLIEKGQYRGTYLCSLDVKEAPLSFNLRGIERVATLPVFTLTLGDDSYRIAPALNIEKATVNYSVSGRSLLFVCPTMPPRVDLLINQQSGREFTAHRALEFVGMLLNGKA